MLLPLKLICPASKARRDGTSIIFLQYCKSENEKTLLNTEIAIPPKYWSKKHSRIIVDLPVDFGVSEKLNEELHRMFRIAEDIIKLAVRLKLDDAVSFTKVTFKPDLDSTKLEEIERALTKKQIEGDQPNLDIYYQIDEYIKSKQGHVSKETIGVFGQMKEHLLAFEVYRKKPITFDCIDLNFYEQLVHFL